MLQFLGPSWEPPGGFFLMRCSGRGSVAFGCTGSCISKRGSAAWSTMVTWWLGLILSATPLVWPPVRCLEPWLRAKVWCVALRALGRCGSKRIKAAVPALSRGPRWSNSKGRPTSLEPASRFLFLSSSFWWSLWLWSSGVNLKYLRGGATGVHTSLMTRSFSRRNRLEENVMLLRPLVLDWKGEWTIEDHCVFSTLI